MFRALFAKHVLQVRTLFLGGLGTAIAIPLLSFAISQFRVSLPFGFGIVTHGTAKDFASALLLLAVCPLFTTVLTLQIMAGDIAENTEPFLAQRPLRGWFVWGTRLLASATVSIAVLVAGIAAHLLLANAAGELGDGDASFSWSFTGLLIVALETVPFVGAAVAAIAGASGTPGLVLALGIDALLVLGGGRAATAFRNVWVLFVTWGALCSVVLVVLCAYAVRGRGEPAGRGRWARGAVTVCATCGIAVPTFLGAATWLVHRAPRAGWDTFFECSPAPAGDVTLVGAWGTAGFRAWLLSTRDGAHLEFFAPPVHAVAWKPDGSVLALATQAAPFGALTRHVFVRFVDARGHVARPSVALPDEGPVPVEVMWAGERVVVRCMGMGTFERLWLVDAQTGARAIDRPRERFESGSLSLLGSAPDGTFYVARSPLSATVVKPHRGRVETGGPTTGTMRFTVYRLRPGELHFDEQPVLDLNDAPQSSGLASLAPSGRLLRVGSRIYDVESGRFMGSAGMEEPLWEAHWAPGDRLVWVDGPQSRPRLCLGGAGVEPIVLRQDGSWFSSPEPAPDGRHVLVTAVRRRGSERTVEHLVYDVASRTWTQVDSVTPPNGGYAQALVSWACSDTLLRRVDRVIELVPLAHPDQPRRIWN